ncbi:LamG-like jellyroll fold domain-containing protein [Nitrospirillum iridis]|uniref:Uncharacterized protein n=1 Tax=Nitrospirillum iridis TaxID=765888 RepID=A0A7X0ECT9_9PROT|nr:LamG-like jellyroll fold domain-containing protein [Nitrospirillum iridis]MBB6251445.1 hypothetical protein [Nitrospirillum iridis]
MSTSWVLNGTTYSEDDFSLENVGYYKIWARFWRDALAEIGNSSPNLVMQSVTALVAIVQGYAAQAAAARDGAVAVSGLGDLGAFSGQVQAGAPAAVFFYDTTRDGDGGAWRLRCAGKTWATQVLNTSTRGKRADFPGRVMFVADATARTVTAYDCDQSTPVMWAVIGGPGKNVDLGAGVPQMLARNGCLYIASNSTGLFEINFLGAEIVTRVTAGGTYIRGEPGVVNANNALSESVYLPARALVTNGAAGVDVTVLPGAPIDRATGLPRPTIAVATPGGVSVIHPSGQVATITDASGAAAVWFTSDGRLGYISGGGIISLGPVPYSTVAATAWRQYIYGDAATSGAINRPGTVAVTKAIVGGWFGGGAGLCLLAEDAVNPTAGMQAVVTSAGNTAYGGGAFNSGWMPGDIRLALSSTATGSVTTSGELVANGTFASSLTGWTAGAGWAQSSGAAAKTAGSAGNLSQTIATVAGQTYLFAADATRSAGTLTVQVAGATVATVTANGTMLVQFTATASSTAISFAGDASFAGTVDNVSVMGAEPDRCVRAIGMRVMGSLTRAAVSAIAPTDLSAWGGFSTSNYLLQPPSAALDFGTGDFSLSVWLRAGAVNQFVVARQPGTGAGYGTTPNWELFTNGSGNYQFNISDGTNGAFVADAGTHTAGTSYDHVVAVKRGSTLEIWVNGWRAATASAGAVGSLTNTAASLLVGCGYSGGALTGAWSAGAVALLRISATAPTPEQITRIFADEAPLFRAGARCVLGGASAAVQALAHDPDTGALYAAKGDGTSVFQGLIRTAHLAGLAATNNSDNHTGVAARQGGYVIATGNQAVAGQPPIFLRDRILSDRVPVAPIDGVHVAFPVGRTTDATATVVARFPVAEGDHGQVVFNVTAAEWGAAPTEIDGYQVRARFYRLPNGNVTITGVQHLGTDTESNTTAMDATLVALNDAAPGVGLQVQGVAGKTIGWASAAEITRFGGARYS